MSNQLLNTCFRVGSPKQLNSLFGEFGMRPLPGTSCEQLNDSTSNFLTAYETLLPAGGIVVTLEPGIYHLSKTFTLDHQDSGTPNSPVVYRGSKAGKVTIMGGVNLSHWHPITDSVLLQELSPAARKYCIQCDLFKSGISHFGNIEHQGFGLNVPVQPAELFYSGRRMTIARYPDSGYLHTGNDTGTNYFSYAGELPSGMEQDPGLWVHGYWDFDWAESYDKVASIDTASHIIKTSPPISGYGYKPDRRFYIMNAPQAINGPNQYYIEPKNGILIFWPPSNFQPEKAQISILNQPLIQMDSADCVSIDNVRLECGRSSGIVINGGGHDKVSRCTVRDMGNDGIDMSSSYYSGVVNCTLDDLGDTGIDISCGNRQTLAPGGDYVTNCTIDRYAQWDFTYHPGISVSGVGNLIDHNDIFDAPHQAIAFAGNNQLIEFNNIHNVCTDTGDAGAVYDGRDLTQRGNIIRDNYFHDIVPNISTPGNFDGVICVYLDDCLCGTTIEDNIFQHVGQGVMIGGGRDNTVQNNIFIGCKQAVSVDARGEGWASNWFNGKYPILMDRLKVVPYNHPPYSLEYHHLANILQDDPAAPLYNKIVDNICVGGTFLELQNGLTDKTVYESDNLEGDTLGTVGIDGSTFAMTPDSKALANGFKVIPFKRIGTYK